MYHDMTKLRNDLRLVEEVVKVKERQWKRVNRAIRLVVLTQLSSCAMERVFSQLKLIRDTCSDGLLEDILEIRMIEMCNGDLCDLYDREENE